MREARALVEQLDLQSLLDRIAAPPPSPALGSAGAAAAGASPPPPPPPPPPPRLSDVLNPPSLASGALERIRDMAQLRPLDDDVEDGDADGLRNEINDELTTTRAGTADPPLPRSGRPTFLEVMRMIMSSRAQPDGRPPAREASELMATRRGGGGARAEVFAPDAPSPLRGGEPLGVGSGSRNRFRGAPEVAVEVEVGALRRTADFSFARDRTADAALLEMQNRVLDEVTHVTP